MATFAQIAPMATIVAFAMAVLLLEVFSTKRRDRLISCLSIGAAAISFLLSAALFGPERWAFRGLLIIDNFSLFSNLIILTGTLLTVLISMNYAKLEGINSGEYYSLLLFGTFGMMVMAASGDLMTIFLGLETVSLSMYVLSGMIRDRLRSNESAMKFFLLGAFAAAFFLYGIAFIYGATGSTNLKVISSFMARRGLYSEPMMLIGLGLLVVGFGFKVAVVPFHMWTPDVYEGSPTSVAAYISAGPKAAGFAALMRLFGFSLGAMRADWIPVFWAIAVLTMTVGNVVAIVQGNIKRMLAYSSIAHAGYLMVALVAPDEAGISSLLFYMLIYTLMNIGAFAVVILVGKSGEEGVEIDDYSGLAYKKPLVAAAMAIFMFSLAGIPPTAGFVGKFYIFNAALRAGFLWLVVIAVVNTVISVYYYLRVVVVMYMREPTQEFNHVCVNASAAAAILISIIGVVPLGIFPSRLLALAIKSIFSL